jgi:uncharacterized protein (DUF433 family)
MSVKQTGSIVPKRPVLGIDNLEAGDSLDTFLDAFPSVTREQAIAALELAREILMTHASSPR